MFYSFWIEFQLTEEYLDQLGLNERQKKAVHYIKGRGKITNKEYKDLNNTSKPTATRDLTDLVHRGIFVLEGKGKRGSFYTLNRK